MMLLLVFLESLLSETPIAPVDFLTASLHLLSPVPSEEVYTSL